MAKQAATQPEGEQSETFEAKGEALAAPKRAGWSFTIPGDLLKVDTKMWSADQRENGVAIGCVFLNPAEENRALSAAVSEGSPASVIVFSVQLSMKTIDGKLVQYADRELVWDALGPTGRQIVAEMYGKANTPSQEALAKARGSFRLSV